MEVSIVVSAEKPKPCFLDNCLKYKVEGNFQIYKDKYEPRFYTWDFTHGEIEVFNKQGKHVGVIDAITGEPIKPPVRGRKINL